MGMGICRCNVHFQYCSVLQYVLLSSHFMFLIPVASAQLWSISTTTLQTRFRIQLNTILFAKTLIRKDSVSSAPPKKEKDQDGNDVESKNKSDDDENDFSSKAQIMTLMTTDTDRLSEFAWHFFALVDSPIELVVGSIFLYKLLGGFLLSAIN